MNIKRQIMLCNFFILMLYSFKSCNAAYKKSLSTDELCDQISSFSQWALKDSHKFIYNTWSNVLKNEKVSINNSEKIRDIYKNEIYRIVLEHSVANDQRFIITNNQQCIIKFMNTVFANSTLFLGVNEQLTSKAAKKRFEDMIKFGCDMCIKIIKTPSKQQNSLYRYGVYIVFLLTSSFYRLENIVWDELFDLKAKPQDMVWDVRLDLLTNHIQGKLEEDLLFAPIIRKTRQQMLDECNSCKNAWFESNKTKEIKDCFVDIHNFRNLFIVILKKGFEDFYNACCS